MSKQLQRLKKEYPQIKEHTFFTINNSVIVMKKDLPLFVGGESRTIERYEKDGMERSKYSLNRLPLYDPVYSAIWKSKNKESKFRPNKQSGSTITNTQAQKTDNLDEYLETLPLYKREIFNMSELDTLDKLGKLIDVEKKEIANRKELGELIDKNDVDKNMASLGGLLMASLTNYEKAAPAELEGKSKQEIQSLIVKVHDDVISELDRVIKLEFDCDETLYEVMGAVLKAISKGKTPREIINGMS